jgi:signal transduction histidine kinase
MVVDQRDADTGVHDRRMPPIGPVMRLLRRRRAAPDSDLALRSVCHELRPSIAALSSLAKALDRGPAEGLRSELTRLTVEHTAHATAVLEQAAAAVNRRPGPRSPLVPMRRVLPVAVACVPPRRLTVQATRAAGRCLVHPSHTQQILINLLDNAVSHSPVGELIRLTAWTSRRRLHLLVTDQGTLTPGLMLALRRRRPPPTDRGLGLWTVRDLVATHGGSLRARQMVPRGLAIEVRLPRVRADAPFEDRPCG